MGKKLVIQLLAGVIVTCTGIVKVWAQNDEQVQWMTFEEAVERSKQEKRKIFIDVYTDWCGWCLVVDRKTFSHPAVSQPLNEVYYPVNFHAAQRGDIAYERTTSKCVSYGGREVPQLAEALRQKEL